MNLDGPAVIASERANGGCRHVTTGLLGFEPRHPAMQVAAKISERKDPLTLVFGEIGPALLEWVVRKLSMEESVVEPEIFCPVPCRRFRSLTEERLKIPEQAYTVHLWNELWSQSGLDRNASYAPHCVYEQLKKRYLP